jgi:hypothetical protein
VCRAKVFRDPRLGVVDERGFEYRGSSWYFLFFLEARQFDVGFLIFLGESLIKIS